MPSEAVSSGLVSSPLSSSDHSSSAAATTHTTVTSMLGATCHPAPTAGIGVAGTGVSASVGGEFVTSGFGVTGGAGVGAFIAGTVVGTAVGVDVCGSPADTPLLVAVPNGDVVCPAVGACSADEGDARSSVIVLTTSVDSATVSAVTDVFTSNSAFASSPASVKNARNAAGVERPPRRLLQHLGVGPCYCLTLQASDFPWAHGVSRPWANEEVLAGVDPPAAAQQP